jgi:hypothetical protein
MITNPDTFVARVPLPAPALSAGSSPMPTPDLSTCSSPVPLIQQAAEVAEAGGEGEAPGDELKDSEAEAEVAPEVPGDA